MKLISQMVNFGFVVKKWSFYQNFFIKWSEYFFCYNILCEMTQNAVDFANLPFKILFQMIFFLLLFEFLYIKTTSWYEFHKLWTFTFFTTGEPVNETSYSNLSGFWCLKWRIRFSFQKAGSQKSEFLITVKILNSIITKDPTKVLSVSQFLKYFICISDPSDAEYTMFKGVDGCSLVFILFSDLQFTSLSRGDFKFQPSAVPPF
jgi:hypothetical protein